MKIIKNPHTTPYFNLATEEYLIDRVPGDIFMIWRNDRAVIIGRNQNAYAELDVGYCKTHNIDVVRRLTGGGAVFHDPGNVNYTFIASGSGSTLDFAGFCRPVIDALASLGVNAELSGRNDLTVDGLKISGNAQTLRNGRVLHHGTLLFDAAIDSMVGALKVDEAKLRSKGIGSVRSRVTNLRSMLDRPLDVVGFFDYIADYVASHVESAEPYSLTDADIAEIRRLTDTKYSTWAWNFGESREYSRRNSVRFPFGTVTVELSCDRGVISAVKLSGDFFATEDVSTLEAALVGVAFDAGSVRDVLGGLDVGRYVAGATVEELVGLLCRY